jgi:hypothetical protein
MKYIVIDSLTTAFALEDTIVIWSQTSNYTGNSGFYVYIWIN